MQVQPPLVTLDGLLRKEWVHWNTVPPTHRAQRKTRVWTAFDASICIATRGTTLLGGHFRVAGRSPAGFAGFNRSGPEADVTHGGLSFLESSPVFVAISDCRVLQMSE
jgi:hypothetical protein